MNFEHELTRKKTKKKKKGFYPNIFIGVGELVRGPGAGRVPETEPVHRVRAAGQQGGLIVAAAFEQDQTESVQSIALHVIAQLDRQLQLLAVVNFLCAVIRVTADGIGLEQRLLVFAELVDEDGVAGVRQSAGVDLPPRVQRCTAL